MSHGRIDDGTRGDPSDHSLVIQEELSKQLRNAAQSAADLCVICGKQIPAERLEALSCFSEAICIDCAKLSPIERAKRRDQRSCCHV